MTTDSKPSHSATNGQGATLAAASSAAPDGSLVGIPLEVSNFLADIEDLLKATTSLTGEELALARAKLSKRIASAKQSVEATAAALSARARSAATVADTYVHQKPWAAIGIGASLGLVIGFVIARRTE
jgi:ElaB/YqjD/DUF883 family membrane-anchored ribosome-binding protein